MKRKFINIYESIEIVKITKSAHQSKLLLDFELLPNEVIYYELIVNRIRKLENESFEKISPDSILAIEIKLAIDCFLNTCYSAKKINHSGDNITSQLLMKFSEDRLFSFGIFQKFVNMLNNESQFHDTSSDEDKQYFLIDNPFSISDNTSVLVLKINEIISKKNDNSLSREELFWQIREILFVIKTFDRNIEVSSK